MNNRIAACILEKQLLCRHEGEQGDNGVDGAEALVAQVVRKEDGENEDARGLEHSLLHQPLQLEPHIGRLGLRARSER